MWMAAAVDQRLPHKGYAAMNALTYYSPLWLGVLIVVALNESVRGMVPTYSPAAQWGVVSIVAIVAALQCQVLMIGAQGAFAQALPVPFGKTVRGGYAVFAGWMLIAWVGLSGVTVLLGYQAVTAASRMVGIASFAALGVFFATYFWSLPTATADFSTRD